MFCYVFLGIQGEIELQVNQEERIICAKKSHSFDSVSSKLDFSQLTSKLKKRLKIAWPCNVKKVWGFLGTITVIKNHLPNHAEFVAPNNKSYQERSTISWGDEQQKAFNKTKPSLPLYLP